MILYLRFGGITIFLLGKSDEGLNIYSATSAKWFLKAYPVSEGLMIVTLLSMITVRIVWIDLFKDIF